MSKAISLTTQAHQCIKQHLNIGDIAIDATIGNGHDTLFLSSQVGSEGQVFGFDVQAQAIEATQEKLEYEKVAKNTQLFHISHSEMKQHIPVSFHGKIKAVMFNLGYLPGSDKTVITQASSTLSALNQSLQLLADKGIITVAAYPGHAGGDTESNLISQWCEQLKPEQYSFELIHSSDKPTAPRLFIIKKLFLTE